jgi:hypothetical protein
LNLTPTQNNERNPITPQKTFAGTKRWLSQLFYNELNKHVSTDDGDYITNGQAMVRNIVRLATDSTGDPYVQLAASKFLLERMEGKAATMTEDTHEEMPKMVICVGNVSADQMKRTIKEKEGAEPKEDIYVEISDGDGENREEMLL